MEFTLGAESGTNGDFAEQAGLEGHWRPSTLITRSVPTMTGNESASGLRGRVKFGPHQLLAPDIL